MFRIPREDYLQEKALIRLECARRQPCLSGEDFERYVSASLKILKRTAKRYAPLSDAGFDVSCLPAPEKKMFDRDDLALLPYQGIVAVEFFLMLGERKGAGRAYGAKTLQKAFGWPRKTAERVMAECRKWWREYCA